MKNLKTFIEEALTGSGVQNDGQDVWVTVDGEQYTISVESVLGREEEEPFEASYTLEEDATHGAWEELYAQYAGRHETLRFEVYEDNGGGLTMFIMDAEGTPIWAHSGYEYTPENLRHDMAQVEGLEDIRDLDAWDGNGVYDGRSFTTWEDMGESLEKVYEKISGDDCVDLVADSDGLYLDNAGEAAREALEK